jgi:hypothetical protein
MWLCDKNLTAPCCTVRKRGHSRRREDLCQAPQPAAANLALLGAQWQKLGLCKGEGGLEFLE